MALSAWLPIHVPPARSQQTTKFGSTQLATGEARASSDVVRPYTVLDKHKKPCQLAVAFASCAEMESIVFNRRLPCLSVFLITYLLNSVKALK